MKFRRRKTEPQVAFDVRAVHLEPGDTVVISPKGDSAHYWSQQQTEVIAHAVKEAFPDNKVVVLDGAMDLRVEGRNV